MTEIPDCFGKHASKRAGQSTSVLLKMNQLGQCVLQRREATLLECRSAIKRIVCRAKALEKAEFSNDCYDRRRDEERE